MKKLLLLTTLLGTLVSTNAMADRWDNDRGWDNDRRDNRDRRWDDRDRGGYGRECRNTNQIMHAAHDLDNQAQDLSRRLTRWGHYSRLAQEAMNLARVADRFHNMVERYVPCNRVHRQFDEVRQSFYYLRKEMRKAQRMGRRGGRGIMMEFRDVEFAFQRLSDSLGGGNHGGGHHGGGYYDFNEYSRF